MVPMIASVFAVEEHVIVQVAIMNTGRDLEGQRGRITRSLAEGDYDILPMSWMESLRLSRRRGLRPSWMSRLGMG